MIFRDLDACSSRLHPFDVVRGTITPLPRVGVRRFGAHGSEELRRVCLSIFRPSSSSAALPAGLEDISIGAFKGCTALASVVLPAGLTTIGKEAFPSATFLVVFSSLHHRNVFAKTPSKIITNETRSVHGVGDAPRGRYQQRPRLGAGVAAQPTALADTLLEDLFPKTHSTKKDFHRTY